MKKNNDTLIKIQQAAYKEFFEKGYMKASLRKICADAGVTTGALYFFFKDKDELFCSLVNDTINEVYKVMMEHYSMEKAIDEKEFKRLLIEEPDMSEDLNTLKEIYHTMYQNRDRLMLIFYKAQGSSLENIVDKFVDLSTEQYIILSAKMSAAAPDVKVSPYFAKWISKTIIDSVIFAVTNIENEEEADLFMDNLITGLHGLWVSTWYPEINGQKGE